MPKVSRRLFLFGGGLVGGSLLVGVAGLGGAAAWLASRDRLVPQRAALPDDGKGPLLAMWIRLDADGQLTVVSPHTEMGQGANTGLLQIVCDELDVPWEKARVEPAPAMTAFSNGAVVQGFLFEDGTPEGFIGAVIRGGFWTLGDLMNMQITGGSASVRFTGWRSMRVGAAAARQVLVAAAAQRLDVPPTELRTDAGQVVHEGSGRSVPYGELVEAAAAMELPSDPPLKDPSAWRYIGQRMPRVDIPDKVFAQATYGMDVAVDGMLHAAVALVPHIGAEVTAITNEDEVLKRRGVHSVHVVPHGVAVVADNPWRAEQAVRTVAFEHSTPPWSRASTAELFQEMRDKLADEDALSVVTDEGDVAAEAAVVLEAEYAVPYVAHAPMESMNATAVMEGDTLHVHVGVQNPLACRANVAEVLGLEPEQVVVHPYTMGGGFGRRASLGADQDHVDAAALLAVATGRPIKLLWSREADIKGCHLRNGSVGRIRATAHADGTIATWDQRSYGKLQGDPHEAVPGYGLAHVRVRNVDERQFPPFAFWRSVDASIYPFFIESMVDELAREAGADPLQTRLAMVGEDSREGRVLKAVAELSAWRTDVVDGKALGLAMVRSFGSVVAQVAEVSMEGNTPKVHTVYVAADLGTAVNPDSVEAQLQGGVQFGLSAALYGRIDFENGGVKQSNFHDYPVVRMADAPRVEVVLLSSPDAPVGGAGEPGVPPVAPAVANAIALLADRPRTLPIIA